MNYIKRKAIGNFSMGIVLFIFVLLFAVLDRNVPDLIAIFIAVIIVIGYFISLRLVMQKNDFLDEYKKSWIYRGIRILQLICIVLLVSKNYINIRISIYDLFAIMSGLYILEAAYWISVLKRVKVIDSDNVK